MKLFIYIFLLVSFSAWSRVNLELVLNADSIKQGEIAPARLIVRDSEGKTTLSGLKGKNIGKTIYLLSVAPFIGKAGQFESDASVIFLKVPEVNSATEVIEGEEIVISWQNLQVLPTEEENSFLFGDFEVPERKEIVPWVIGLLLLLVTGSMIYWLSQKLKIKKLNKLKLIKLKQELLECRNYDEIVLMWRQKQTYLNTFPQLDKTFKHFEQTLFKYQFKPQRTSLELDEVQKAYEEFKTEILGALNGI